MIRIYCRGQQHDGPICAGCEQLLNYALCRLDRCPFGADKTACASCPIHCYKPEMRARVRAVMRYAGPRMLLRHPIVALRHLPDGRRRPPGRRALDGGRPMPDGNGAGGSTRRSRGSEEQP